MDQVPVTLGSRSYSIYIEEGLLRDLLPVAAEFPSGRRLVAVTDETVAALYGGVLEQSFKVLGLHVPLIILPPGEEQKSFSGLQEVHDRLLEHGCDRSSAVVALGGGVIGDLAGFAAATFMRGIPYYQVPTTLLAQVDSSVGGKTGINHPRGKNLIGAFHQPQAVLIDSEVLASLPEREFRSGLAEVIKYGLIGDAALFAFLEENLERVLARDPSSLLTAVRICCEIKAHIVSEDEQDHGRRALLNFGHTFGHAIEKAAGFGVWTHGEAVSVGMVTAAHLSHQMGMCSEAAVQRVQTLLQRSGLPVRMQRLDAEELVDAMRYDKKARRGALRLLLMDAIGSVRLVEGVSEEAVRVCLATLG